VRLYEDCRYKSEGKNVLLKQVHLIGLGSSLEVDKKPEFAKCLWNQVKGPDKSGGPDLLLDRAIWSDRCAISV
jgi:hypothetical protein